MTTAYPLYDPQMEHESCGVGAVIDLRAQATHRTVSDALTIVERLAHRAGSDATGTTGDGVGILTRLPHALFARWAAEAGVSLGEEGEYAVGMFFLPDDEIAAENMLPHLRCRWRRRKGLRVLLLARRALPSGTAGRVGAAQHAPHPPVLSRPPAGCRPRGGVRPAPLHPPPAVRKAADRRLCLLPLLPHHRLQGHDAGDAAARLLRRFAKRGLRLAAGDGSLPLFHQHLPQLGEGAPAAPAFAQWRDQHHPRQLRPHARPRRDDAFAAAWGRRCGACCPSSSRAVRIRRCWTTRWNFSI